MTSLWVGSRVRLRGIEPADWAGFMEFDSDSADQRAGDMVHPPRSAEGYRAWTKERAAAEPVGDRFQLAIEAVDTGKLVGGISSNRADLRAGWFEYGIGIMAGQQRKGYASEAVVLLLRFMFGERRYHKCTASVYAFNEASLALHGRLGFVEEGRLREHVFLAGRHHDLVMMGMLASDFARSHPAAVLPSGGSTGVSGPLGIGSQG
ncbi:GNAT family N-acetyltransferase [Actinocrispum wychmicini]|uniref:RimJ/RimL family protein N-acetyltransferase n=1 Tax=Actinocrispum wychmicini TaxID=1213861 RepID=A0A4R2IHG2_9PSEU|nr:GNAT family protein [Actinocrispum wychmicini]TCO44183.1 RimJ/RimL family protein N-acetyltransferase [Actinocrispum wychmicini]